MGDIHVQTRFKNNLLREKIFNKYSSVAEFCRNNGIDKQVVSSLLNFKKNPMLKNGTWSKVASDVANALMCLEEDLFPERLRDKRKNVFETEIESERLLAYSDDGGMSKMVEYNNPEKIIIDIDEGNQSRRLLNVLHTLTPREEKILRMRFGIDDGNEMTLDETASFFNVSRERIRQLENKAFRKIRHPSRSNLIFKPPIEQTNYTSKGERCGNNKTKFSPRR